MLTKEAQSGKIFPENFRRKKKLAIVEVNSNERKINDDIVT